MTNPGFGLLISRRVHVVIVIFPYGDFGGFPSYHLAVEIAYLFGILDGEICPGNRTNW